MLQSLASSVLTNSCFYNVEDAQDVDVSVNTGDYTGDHDDTGDHSILGLSDSICEYDQNSSCVSSAVKSNI